MDPFQVRRLAAAVGVDERTGAYAVSLALTVGVAVACAGVGALASAALPRLSPPAHNAAHNATGVAAADGADLWLQPLWAALTQPGHPSGLAPLTASPLFPGLASIAFYFLACAPLAVLDVLDIAWVRRRFKSQPSKSAVAGDWSHTLALTGRNHALFILPGLTFQLVAKGPWLYRDPLCLLYCDGADLFPAAAPTVLELIVQVLLCLVIFDAGYHFWHRWHHLSPPLYKHVHRVHHEYFSPFAWVTQYEHALELIAVSVFSLAVPIGVGCHPLTEWVWLLAAIQVSVDAHSGYDFGVLDKICPLWGGAVHHDRHHAKPTSNFQPFFTWFDWWFETDFHATERREEARRASKALGKAKQT